MRRLVIVTAIVMVSVLGAFALAPSPARASYPLPPMMPRTRLPMTTAGSWKYVQYQHEFALQAYQCASGVIVAGYLGNRSDTAACTDWRLVVKATSIRARLWHALDYYVRFAFNADDWKFFDAVMSIYFAYAKVIAKAGQVAYWSAETTACAALLIKLKANAWLASVAVGACHWAFDYYNPFGRL